MTPELFALIAGVVAIAALVQGSTGMGFALIVAPVAGAVAPSLLPVMLLILMLPLNAYVVWRERRHLDFSGAGWITAGRVAGTVVGFWVLVAVPPSGVGILIGVSTILAVLASIFVPAFVPGRAALVTVGAVTGITETATGVGGPPLVLAYQHRPAPVLRSTVALCFVVGELLSLVLLAVAGKVQAEQVTTAGMLLPAVALGAGISGALHHRLGGKRMRALVLGFSLISGVAVLFH